MSLPTQKTSRAGMDPRDARVMLAGTPKVGKTTLAGAWAPDTTLLLDTHRGTVLLDGEHYVEHIDSFSMFEKKVDEIVKTQHPFRTIVVDLIEDVWKMADLAAARANGKVAAGLVEYGKGTAHAEGLFRHAVGKLLQSQYGIWFLTHVDRVEDEGVTQYVPRLDKRVKPLVQGSCDFVFLAEALGPKRRLHTAPSARFEAGSRWPLPPQMDFDARALFSAMKKGLTVPTGTAPAAPQTSTTPEQVPA